MTAKITVVVEVYNVEKYLPRCLESLVAQTMQEIEILLIDDGSTDRSGEICADYAARDSRFRLLRQENRGLCATRNRALDEATGTYLMFVDADDWVEPDFCETPWRCAAEHQADLVLFRYRSVKENGALRPLTGTVPVGQIDREKALRMLFGVSGSYVWDKLWKRSLFDGVRFPDVLAYGDVGTSFFPVLRAERIFSLDRVLYYYRKRRGSLITLRSDKATEDHFAMYSGRLRFLEEQGFDPELLQAKRSAVCLTYAMRRKEDPANPTSLTAYRTLRELPAIPRTMDRRHRAMLFLLRRCPPLFDLCCRLLKRRGNGRKGTRR